MIVHEVRAAVQAERVIEFGYVNAPTVILQRTVSPWQCDENSFLGFDHGRDEIRRFRYDKVFANDAPDERAPIEPCNDENYVHPQ